MAAMMEHRGLRVGSTRVPMMRWLLNKNRKNKTINENRTKDKHNEVWSHPAFEGLDDHGSLSKGAPLATHGDGAPDLVGVVLTV